MNPWSASYRDAGVLQLSPLPPLPRSAALFAGIRSAPAKATRVRFPPAYTCLPIPKHPAQTTSQSHPAFLRHSIPPRTLHSRARTIISRAALIWTISSAPCYRLQLDSTDHGSTVDLDNVITSASANIPARCLSSHSSNTKAS